MIWKSGRWQVWKARRLGRRDGRRGIPDPAARAHPPELDGIRRAGTEHLEQLERDWAREDARLKVDFCSAAARFQRATAAEGAAAAELEAARERAAAFALEAQADRAERRRDGRGLEHEWRMSPLAYRLALLAIIIGELPLNAVAFRLFREAEVLTWLMTLGVASILVLCAHGLGILLRLERRTFVQRVWVAVLVALPLLGISAIAVVRARYLAALGANGDGDVLGPVGSGLVFAALNALIFGGAAMLSYLAHDPLVRRDRQLQAVLEERRRRLASTGQGTLEAEVALERAVALRQKAFQAARADVLRHRAFYERLMRAYCGSNLRARRDAAVPGVLEELPEVPLPPAFVSRDPATLDWDCHRPSENISGDGQRGRVVRIPAGWPGLSSAEGER